MYSQIFISPSKAYLTNGNKEYVVWNPSTLTITGTIPLPVLAQREGIDGNFGMDRGTALRGNLLFHTANWFDYEGYKMLDSRVAIFDVETDSLVDLLENPCPNFDIATSDDAGNLYFSNWVYSPGATLVNDQAQACVGRIAAGEDVFDASWSLKMADVTEGREAAALGYLGGSEGLLSVFHDERVTYDPSTGDIFSYLFGANWHLWTVDLVSKAAHEITAIDWNGGGYYSYRIDGKTYVLSPGSDYKTTTVYEVSGDGSVTQILHTRGWSTRLFKLR